MTTLNFWGKQGGEGFECAAITLLDTSFDGSIVLSRVGKVDCWVERAEAAELRHAPRRLEPGVVLLIRC